MRTHIEKIVDEDTYLEDTAETDEGEAVVDIRTHTYRSIRTHTYRGER